MSSIQGKDYKSLYLKYKSKYLQAKKESHSKNCQDHDLDPKACQENPNCEWDFRRICLTKGKAVKMPDDPAGLVGSYLSTSNTRNIFLLNEINKNLEEAMKFAQKGNRLLTKNKIDKINELTTQVENYPLEKNIEVTEKIINIMDVLNKNEEEFLIKTIEEKLSKPNPIRLYVKPYIESLKNINYKKAQEFEAEFKKEQPEVKKDNETIKKEIARMIQKLRIAKRNKSTILFSSIISKLENLIKSPDITIEERITFEQEINSIKLIDEATVNESLKQDISNKLEKTRDLAFKGNTETMNSMIKIIMSRIKKLQTEDPEYYQKVIQEIDNIKQVSKEI
ncbi:hypothetical protein CPAV1605_540 [seawater metagenome]|uniref:Uncharacterized protein n=1 Tax=seawater metagenome TaxID=1561972 RepID=A0A5E8CLF5_9ZZZZ